MNKKKLVKKLYNSFINSNAAAAIAENPSVMIASGWTIEPNEITIQDKFNTHSI